MSYFDGLPAMMKIHNPTVQKRGSRYAVVDDDGHVYGTHPNEEAAKAQVAALFAAKEGEKAETPTFRKQHEMLPGPVMTGAQKTKPPEAPTLLKAGATPVADRKRALQK